MYQQVYFEDIVILIFKTFFYHIIIYIGITIYFIQGSKTTYDKV